MHILLTAGLLFGTAAALAILRATRPRFRFTWLIGAVAAAAAWISVFSWRPQLPLALSLPLWESSTGANSFATFSVSAATWPYALCLVSLALTLLLTAPARPGFPNPLTWAQCLAIASLGLLVSTSDSPLTLVIFWASLDLVEAGRVLARPENRSPGGEVAFAFTVRLLSMGLVLLALVFGTASETNRGFGAIPGPAVWLLPAAAPLRLMAFGIPWTRSAGVPAVDEVGTMLQLVAGCSAVAFLSQSTIDAREAPGALMIVCAFLGLFAGWMWLRAPDLNSARPLWILGTGSLAVMAILRENPLGVTAWGSAMLLAGGALFLTSAHEKWMSRAIFGGLWLVSALPFSLSGAAWEGGGAGDWILPASLVLQASLLAGFLHQAVKLEVLQGRRLESAPLSSLYQVGIVLPLATGVLLGVWGWPGAMHVGWPPAAAVAVVFSAGLVWAKRRLPGLNPTATMWLPANREGLLAFGNLALVRLHRWLQRATHAITRTIEGEAGIMWSLLLLILFISLLARRAP